MKPGIKDVAKVAGVSPTTVSRVLNNRGYISEETRKKVYDAMEKIGYHPNELAKNFFRQKTNIIGLILPDISISFYAEETKYIEEHLYKNGYKLMLCNAYNSKEREKEYINMLQRNKVDGIIIGSHTLEIEDYLKIDMPIVALDRYLGENIPIVSADHIQGGILAANHLINCGCKNVVQFAGTSVLNSSANKRHISFEKVMNDSNVNVHTIETSKLSHEDYAEILEATNENLLKRYRLNLSDIEGKSNEEVINIIYDNVVKDYEEKISDVPTEIIQEFEKAISLRVIDNYWMEHISTMSHLREGIHLRGYAQENPLQAYTLEGYELFDEMLNRINKDISIYLLKSEIRQNIERKEIVKKKMTNEGKEGGTRTPKKSEKIGRNDPCPCGSGKKYKQCCGK